uniref:Uncharacterized protein n=1 Tax=Oryza meridionalis TaxID=40149 RepID=A0A0E0DK87_9ORYZ
MAALRFKIPRKRFRLLVRTPGGTMSMQDGERLTTTPLGREVWLRWHLLIFDQTIYAVDGIRTWDAYARHLPDIAAATAAIAAVLRAYRERRVELGLFHLRPLRKLLVFRLMSPLLVMPLPDALKKWRSLRRRRRHARLLLQNKSSSGNSSAATSIYGRCCTTGFIYPVYLLFVRGDFSLCNYLLVTAN